MNHDNVSYCLRSNEDYQDEWRGTSYPLHSSQNPSALLFLMLRDLLVIIATNVLKGPKPFRNGGASIPEGTRICHKI